MPPTIRPATSADIAAIRAIYADAVETGTASFEIEAPSLDEMAARHAALVRKGYPYLVAEEDGAVLGYAYAGPYRPRPAYRFSVENSVYVAPCAKGRSIGSALMAPLIAAATAGGFRQMIAVIGDSANAGSIALHRRFGFHPVGTFEAAGFKFGRWIDSVLMQRALGEGSASPPADAALR